MDSIKKLYSDTLAKIDNFSSILTSIEDGQSTSIDGIKYQTIFSNVYEKSTGQDPDADFMGLSGTKTLIGQALSDLGNAWYSNRFYGGSTGDSIDEFKPGFTRYEGNYGTGKLIWINFIRELEDAGFLPEYETSLNTPRTGNVNDDGLDDVKSITKYNGVDVFSEDGKPTEWYYQNFQKTLLGQETNWDTLNSYIDTLKLTVGPYEKKAKLESLGGGFLLVDQAIKKAFLKLSMTNLDVTEFAPLDSDGNNFFQKIMRTGALGPSGTTPFPSKYSTDPEDYQVKPYTNTAFLCYHGLLTIIKSVSTSASRQFLLDNITTPDSDHDKVIDLMKDVHSGTITGSTSGASPRSAISPTSRNIQVLLHLYKQMEAFPISEAIYLIPEEDSVPISERSFVQWYLKRIRHTTEHDVKEDSANSQEGYRFLADDYPSSVKGGSSDIGKLDVDDVPQVYADIGYLSPYPDEATVNRRLLKANYGIPEPPNGLTRDILEFYKQRRYSMPYFWACMTSLWRAITSEVLKNLVDSVNEILGTELSLTTQQLLENMDHGPLWIRIRQITNDLIEENNIEFRIYASVDGTLNFVERNAEAGSLANSVQYRNTPGLNTKMMLQSFVKFVSLVSDHSSIQHVEKHSPIEFDSATYLPPEGISKASNPNYANNHGGSSQYIETDFSPYFDKLELTKAEFDAKLPIKKSKSPIGEDIQKINSRYQSFLSDNQRFFQHLQMFEFIVEAFQNIEKFVNSFSVSEDIKDVFISGEISLTEDLQDPNTLKKQIAINRTKYEANEFGIGKRWLWKGFSPELVEMAAQQQGEGWLYIQVLGLESKLWSDFDGVVQVVPEFITDSQTVKITRAIHSFKYNEARTKDERRSSAILKYLHLSTGLDISELTFSKNLDIEYSDILIDSESEVFPWVKGDFEEGVPTKPLETLYNMSPLLFPQNMFKDVCVKNTYQRVVACVITKEDLLDTGISLEEIEGSIDDIIGSLRWRVV